MKTTTDQRALERRQRQERVERQAREADLRALLKEPAFRRFLVRHIEEDCGAHALCFSSNGSEQYFKQGRRSVGIDLREQVMKLDPQSWVTALAESLSDRLQRAKLNDEEEKHDG